MSTTILSSLGDFVIICRRFRLSLLFRCVSVLDHLMFSIIFGLSLFFCVGFVDVPQTCHILRILIRIVTKLIDKLYLTTLCPCMRHKTIQHNGIIVYW